MASREESLLFLVDVQVKNSQALRQLSRDFDALQGKMDRHMESLRDADQIEQQRAGANYGAGPSVVPGSNQPAQGSGSQIVGVRSSHAPGSRMNPIVTVQESGLAGGLGSLAAGAPNASSEGGGPSASDIANAIQAQNPNAGGIDPQVIDQTIRDVTTKVVAPENDRVIQAIQAQTDAQHRVAQAIMGGGSGPSVAQDAVNRQQMAQALVDALEGRRTQVAAQPRTMTTGDAAQVLGRPRTVIREMAATGAIPGAQKQQGQWMLPEDQVEKMLEDIENAKAGGGGAGGGGRPPVALGAGGGGAGRGGGGSRFQWSPFGGSRSNPDSGVGGALSFGNLFKGDGGRGGAFGLPGFGSIGSLGGLGLEHWILSALGVGASATSAVGGASLLGAASLTKSVIGGGADALVNKTTITDAKNYQTQLDALNKAIAVYGKVSPQAAAAQYDLNQTMKDMGGAADVTAIKALDAQVQTLRYSFDQASAAARVSSAEIDLQVVGLAQTYVPAVTQAAQRNLALINTAIKPLFTWLEGPQGMGIFRSMENSFAQGLPTTIHAASMAIEDFLRLMQAALPYTGGLSKALDNFFTSKNKEDASAYDAEVQKLVGDLREWEGLLKLLGQDLDLVFKQDAGTANAIVGSLTQMLQKLHDWETSSTGQSQLKTIFAVHKQQILELLKVFENLAGDYGHFYMDVAPSVVKAVTDIAGAFVKVADAIAKVPGGADILGLGIVLSRLKVLNPLLKAAAKSMGLIDAAEKGGGTGGLGLPGGSTGTRGAVRGAESSGESDLLSTGEGAGGGGIAAAIATKLAGVAGGGGSEIGGGLAIEGLTAALTTAATVAIPPAILAAMAVGFQHFAGQPGGTATWQHGHITGLAAPATPSNEGGNGRFGPVVAPTSNTLRSQTLNIKELGDFSNTSASALRGLIKEINDAGSVKLNGISKSKDDVLALADAALKTKGAFSQAYDFVNLFYRDTGRSLSSLKDDYQSNFKLIENTVGLTSSQTATLLGKNTQKMVQALQAGMLDGQVSVKQGMKTLNQVLQQGMQNGSTKWTTDWQDMFSTVTSLYQHNKIDSKTYMSDMQSIMGQGEQQIKQGSQKTYEQIVQNLQAQLQKGDITQQQFNTNQKQALAQMNTNTRSGMQEFVGQMVEAFANVSGQGGKGLGDLITTTNNALKLLHAKPLGSLQIEVLSAAGAASSAGSKAASGVKGLFAGGGLLQIGVAGAAGGDNISVDAAGTPIRVGAGEQIAVFNRHQQPIVNRALAREGYAGLPGLFRSVTTPHYMASGGLVPGHGDESLVTASWYYGGTTADGQDADTTPGFAELSHDYQDGVNADFSALGGLPMHTMLAVTYGGKTITIPKIDVGAGGPAIPPATIRAIDLTPPAKAALNFPGLANVDINIGGIGGAGSVAAGGAGSVPNINAPDVKGQGPFATLAKAALDTVAKAANSYLQQQAPAANALPGMGGAPTFPVSKGPVPAKVQQAKEFATWIANKGLPYHAPGFGMADIENGTGLDCSGFVSTVFNEVGLVNGYQLSGYYEQWGEPGPGKWITTGALGPYSGPEGHVMMEIDGTYFESGGRTSAGPHIDSGWSSPFTSYRHPTGYAGGGQIGQQGHQLTVAQLAAMTSGLGAKATAASKLTPAEQAFVKKNKGKPKHGKAPKHKGPKLTAPGKPKAETPSTSGPGIIGGDGPFPFNDATDLSHIDQMLNAIYSIAGGADGIPGNGNIMGLEGDISYYTNAWGAGIASPPYPNAAGSFFGSFSSPSDFVTSTTDSAGNTTYAIDPNINTVAGQLAQMIGWQSGIVGDLTGANAQAGALAPLSGAGGPINKAIERRKAEIKKITDRVNANAKKIADYQAKVKAAKAKIKTAQHKQAALQKQIAQAQAKQPPYSNPKTKAEKKANATFKKSQGLLIAGLAGQLPMLQSEIDGYQKQIKTWTGDVSPLEAENVTLGGSKDKMGTGGEYGTIFGQLGAPASGTSGIGLAEGSGQGASGLYDLLSTVQSWQAAIGGTNGDLAQQQLTLQEWNTDYGALIPGANSALAADNLANVAATTNSTSPITGTVAFQFNGNEVLASTLQGMAQGGLLPWAGSFMTGGVIPGPIGASALAEVHGGEVITNPYLPGQGGGDTSGLSTAMSQLTSALCDHKAAVMQNTTAMKSNTTAVSSTTGGGAGVRYSGGAYSPHTSSDSVVGLAVGQ